MGSNAGSLTVHFLTDELHAKGNYYIIKEVAYRKDCKAECSDVKFSPSNDKIALGCHDDCISVYACSLQVLSYNPPPPPHLSLSVCVLTWCYLI